MTQCVAAESKKITNTDSGPCELTLPDEFKKVTNVWLSNNHPIIFVTCEKHDGKKMTFSAGKVHYLRGIGSSGESQALKPVILPSGTYFIDVKAGRERVVAID